MKPRYVIYSSYTAGLELAKHFLKHRDLLVVTPASTPFKHLYDKYLGDNVIYFDDINEDKLFDKLSRFEHATGIACVFSEKIPERLIKLAANRAVNIHPSRLPQIRTGDSSFWNIILEDDSFGVTTHLLTNQWDSGDILYQDILPLPHRATCQSIIATVRKYMEINAERYLELFETTQLTLTKQVGGTYYAKVKVDELGLSLNESSDFIDRVVRASNSDNKVLVGLREHKVGLVEVEKTSTFKSSSDTAGKLSIVDGKLLMITVDGALKLNVLHTDEYGILSAERFIACFALEASEQFFPIESPVTAKIYSAYLKALT